MPMKWPTKGLRGSHKKPALAPTERPAWTVAMIDAAARGNEIAMQHAESELAAMEGLLRDVICPLREGINNENALQKKLTVLATVGEQCGFNSPLLLSALSTLSKAPNARSPMDAEVINELQSEVCRKIEAAKDLQMTAQVDKAAAVGRAEVARGAAPKCWGARKVKRSKPEVGAESPESERNVAVKRSKPAVGAESPESETMHTTTPPNDTFSSGMQSLRAVCSKRGVEQKGSWCDLVLRIHATEEAAMAGG